MQIITWLVAAMFAWAPARDTERPRYTEIASDLAAVTFDESEVPLFAGASGRSQTALLLASVAAHHLPEGRRGRACARRLRELVVLHAVACRSWQNG
jgi:hypothetical protein